MKERLAVSGYSTKRFEALVLLPPAQVSSAFGCCINNGVNWQVDKAGLFGVLFGGKIER
ncbi:hypothetical protein NITHO_4670003 [Nitrolancea hollandica Lb]|uniref:Uncharacterized protein n=1 Tax=Nitrolancea hollandica Lb TaxID=1129897 RepID=I4EKK4_9BACT|nr:hypothetical protein NITHO_4670003 [Nitrolancea hollandica Lb]